jgi:outer membrane biosynthesis protein TonB
VHLSPREGQTGSRVTVTARGYGANETIEIQWPQGEDWVTIKTRDTGSTGSMRTLITVPDFAVPGRAYVRGLSPTGDHKAPFTVLASSTSEVQTPTPEPTPEATSTPEPSATTQPTEEPAATPTETPVTEPTQTPAPEPTEPPAPEEPTAEPSPTVEPAATETP